VPDYGYELGGIAALDTTAGVLYWPGQAMNASDNAPYYLIGLSIADASVVVRFPDCCCACLRRTASHQLHPYRTHTAAQSSAMLCETAAGCPWSLEWYAGSDARRA